MKFKDITRHLSEARINRYLAAANNSKTLAVRMYKTNLKIAQAFHPLLGILEVTLRNHLNEILTQHFSDKDWIIHEKTGFMSAPSLSYIHKKKGTRVINDYLKREVQKAEKRLAKSGTPITSGKIIAEQTLGFWTSLFEVHHYRLLRGKPIQVFQRLASATGRKAVFDNLNKIRLFRNRVNHNEPVCFKGHRFDLSFAEEVYQSIHEILNWIDPELIKWIADIDSVPSKMKSAKNAISKINVNAK